MLVLLLRIDLAAQGGLRCLRARAGPRAALPRCRVEQRLAQRLGASQYADRFDAQAGDGEGAGGVLGKCAGLAVVGE